MRQCPGCSYFVPPVWESCERCGADLSENAKPAVSDSSAAEPATASSGDLGGYFASRADPGPAPGRIPGSLPDESLESLSVPGSSSRSSSSRPRGLAAAVYALCAVVLVAAGWYGYRQLTAENIDLEPDAQAYVDGEASVPIENAAARFRVELPAAPEVLDQSMTVQGGTFTVHLEMSQVDPDYAVGVGYVDGPPGSEGELEALLAEGDGAQFVAAGDTVSVESTQHAGHQAVDVVVDVEGISTKVRMVPVGTRIYMAMVVSPYDSAPGFDRLVESFELLGVPTGAA